MKDFVIQKVTAFLNIDDEGNEGVVAYLSPSGMWMPLIGGYPQVIEIMRGKAIEISRKTGKKIFEVEFSNRVDKGILKTHAE